MSDTHSLVLDVGTTGIKAFVFDGKLNLVAKNYLHLNKQFPKRGWVEQNPHEIIKKAEAVLSEVVKTAKVPLITIASLGITNQRETTVLWDKKTGKPVYPAIVWEDTRTVAKCSRLEKKYGSRGRRKTGVRNNPH